MDLNQQIENWLLESFSVFDSEKRPFITLAYAQSWDGSITTRCGETLNFSGEESMRVTHQLRSLHDGIMVGIGTVLSDDPQLTVREWSGKNPQPVVLDSQLRTPETAKVCRHPDKKCWVLTAVGSDGQQLDTQVETAEAMSEQRADSANANSASGGLEILTVGSSDGDRQQVPLDAAMKLLRTRGIKSLMVEGGAEIITALLQSHLADALVLTVAPRLVGGYKAVGDLQSSDAAGDLMIRPLHFAQAGDDLLVWGTLQYGSRAT